MLMRKVLKWIGLILGSLIGLVVLAVVIILSIGRSRFNQTYDIAVPVLDIPTDEAAVARGEHLVNAVAHCAYCHGEGLQGDYLENDPSTIGVIVAPNLTAGEGGLGGAYTSDDWIRTLRHGVTPDSRSAFIMPSLFFNHMSEDDLAATIAYLQSVPPVDNVLPATEPGTMAYALLGAGPLQEAQSARRIDHAAPFVDAPPEAETAEYGAYLAQIAQCSGCHGDELAGGQACQDCPIGPNLTPGGELQGWTQDDFVTVIRTGTVPTGRQLSEFMPWQYFQNMTDTELAALWAYLQSQPARETVVP
jgi:mono/diheme cytochrome c family protein